MRKLLPFITAALLLASCTSQKKLAYLSDLPADKENLFSASLPDYKLQKRDIVYITVKAMTPEGRIEDFLSSPVNNASTQIGGGEAGSYIQGYSIDNEGNICLPVIGQIEAEGLTVDELRKQVQDKANAVFREATAECKLLSFKFTVIGEVKSPGTYMNYNNQLTIFEAIGRAGGIDNYGQRNKILVIRPTTQGTKTFTLNLQNKDLLSSQAYFLLPNDVVLVEPMRQKIFNLNLPTVAFALSTIFSSITTAVLLINYFGN